MELEIKKKRWLRHDQGNYEIPAREIWQVETYLDSITQIIRCNGIEDQRIKQKAHKALSIIRKWTQKITCGEEKQPKNKAGSKVPAPLRQKS